MSRHRIVRTMDYNEEYDGYDDVYGHSVDDDSCISPSDASQWIYDRARGQQSISAFMANNRNIEEENEDGEGENSGNFEKKRRDSENFQMPVLNDIDQAKLISCIDEIRSIVGDTISERQIVETTMKYNYDVAKTLDTILNTSKTPPQEKAIGKSTILKETIEKDFKQNLLNDNLVDSKTQTSTKLNDYIKNNLQNSKLPSTSFSIKPKFTLPKLKNNFCTSETPNNSKLNEFIKIQLKKSNNNLSSIENSKQKHIFKIPKLNTSARFNDNDSIEQQITPKSSPTPHELSLQKIIENKNKITKNQINEISNKIDHLTIDNKINPEIDTKEIIDLTKALSFGKSQENVKILDKNNILKNNLKYSSNDEKFQIPFIKCDIIDTNQNLLTEYCQLDISNVYCKNLTNCISSPTRFGKVLALKYRCKNMPYITHEFIRKNNIDQFKFDTKSPDDVILQNIKRNYIHH